MHLGISITILPVAILRERLKNHPVAPITRIFLWTILEFDIQMYDVREIINIRICQPP